MKTISTSDPVRDLLEHAGVSRSELARRLSVPQPGIPAAIDRGPRVTLGWLAKAADASGFILEIRLVPKKRTSRRKK